MHKAPILVHIVFHPDSEDARELAIHIHKSLNADPAVPGLRIPTVFCPTDGTLPPDDYDVDQAEWNLVVVLADHFVVDNDTKIEPKWSSFIGDLWQQCDTSDNKFFPIQLHSAAWDFDDRLNRTNFLRAFSEEKEERNALVVRRLLIALCDHLTSSKEENEKCQAPITLFLSHTKMDIASDPQVANILTHYLNHTQPVRAWFDSGDIDVGSQFEQKITEGIEDSSLLCILTDNYSSREWCRKEILLAKEKNRPIVVISALNRQEVRSFPYLGNVPVMRWPTYGNKKKGDMKFAFNQNAAAKAVDLMLKETVRLQHTEIILNAAKQTNEAVFSRPPELFGLLKVNNGETVLYPDPPLGEEELEILQQTGVAMTTPMLRITSNRSLQKKKIALSMSESTDIRRFGFDEVHLKDVMIELSRNLVLKGATLVYGGHLGDEGYTQLLIEMVRSYHNITGMEPVERIINTVGWPLPYNRELQVKYRKTALLERIDRPADLHDCPGNEIADKVEATPFPPNQSAEYRYCWSRGMTNMRKAQVDSAMDIKARIILGGKFGPPESGFGKEENWYAGRIPGVLEEVVLAVQENQPVFLIGAFGGAAKMICDLLEGEDRAEATWEYQKRAPFSEEIRDLYLRCNQEWMDYPEMVEILREKGVSGINSLSADENLELFHCRDNNRIIELILKGLDELETE